MRSRLLFGSLRRTDVRRRRSSRATWALVFLLSSFGALQVAHGQDADEADTDNRKGELFEFEELDLGDLLDTSVVTATKFALSQRDAPAIITVIDQDEILAAGYRSVAEALESSPGLVVNTDHVISNVGVRGINGGIRSGSRHLKLLINGQPVAFRPDSLVLLGPELIPISIVERIEIIRGPASSLYGFNAFLGVINIITRKPIEFANALIRGEAGRIQEGFSAGASAVVAHDDDRIGLLLAGSAHRIDRSGLELPESSPDFMDYAGDSMSRDDISQPVSFFGQLSYDLRTFGNLTVEGNYQQLNSRAEWVDTGALSHVSTTDIRQGYVRGAYRFDSEIIQFRLSGSYAAGSPGDDDIIQPIIDGQPTGFLVERDFGYESFNLVGEVQLNLWESSAIIGVEYDVDQEDLRRNIFISRDAGQELSGQDFGEETFTDIGVYLQVLIGEIEQLKISGNVRFDSSNQFGDFFNYRLAAAWRVYGDFYVKAISGSSFRVPSPEQLYATPVRPGGVQGSLSAEDPFTLPSQEALMQELQLGYSSTNITATLNAYVMNVSNRIEFIRRGGDLQVPNVSDSLTVGGELSLEIQYPGIFDLFDLRFRGAASWQQTEVSLEGEFTPRERELATLNELYPEWSFNGLLNIAIPDWYLNLNIRVNVLTERPESQSNQDIGRPFTGDPLRFIPTSWPFHLSISTLDVRILQDKETVLQFVLNDVFETRSEEPGFNGINIPPLGRRFSVILTQEL